MLNISAFFIRHIKFLSVFAIVIFDVSSAYATPTLYSEYYNHSIALLPIHDGPHLFFDGKYVNIERVPMSVFGISQDLKNRGPFPDTMYISFLGGRFIGATSGCINTSLIDCRVAHMEGGKLILESDNDTFYADLSGISYNMGVYNQGGNGGSLVAVDVESSQGTGPLSNLAGSQLAHSDFRYHIDFTLNELIGIDFLSEDSLSSGSMSIRRFNYSLTHTPEPSTAILLCLGFLATRFSIRKKN